MKRVGSGREPEILTAFRAANPEGTWIQFKDLPGNEAVFEALAGAQGYVCAYCEIRITRRFGQIEHFEPKSSSTVGRNLHLELANLLACCEGGTIRGNQERTEEPIRETMHCGPLKGDANPEGRMIDPRSIPTSPPLWRTTQGQLSVDLTACSNSGVDSRLAESTLTFLGLNRRGLRRLREATVTELDKELEGSTDDDDIFRRIAVAAERNLVPDQDGRLLPFWSTIRAWAGPDIEPFILANAAKIPGMT